MSQLYSLTKQYRPDNDNYVWFVEIHIEMEEDFLINLCSIAKDWDGYYSSQWDLKGFVFMYENDAKDFMEIFKLFSEEMCLNSVKDDKEELDELLPKYNERLMKINLEEKEINFQYEKYLYNKRKEEFVKLSLHDSIVELVKKYGIEILKNKYLINMLDDYNAFRNEPSLKFIFKTILNDIGLDIIKNIKDNTNEIQKIIEKLSIQKGFKKDFIKKIIKILINVVNEFNFSNNPCHSNLKVEENINKIHQKNNQAIFSDLYFIGIKLGSVLKDFKDEFYQRKVQFIGQYRKNNIENYGRYNGKFLEINSWNFDLYFSPIKKFVYRIEISKMNRSKIGNFEKVFDFIFNVYKKKYQDYQEIIYDELDENVQKEISFSINKHECIILKTGKKWGNLIIYHNKKLEYLAEEEIKEKELNNKIKQIIKENSRIDFKDI